MTSKASMKVAMIQTTKREEKMESELRCIIEYFQGFEEAPPWREEIVRVCQEALNAKD